MSNILDRAARMLADNRKLRRWCIAAGALAVVLVATVSALLVGNANALAGGDTLRNAITGDSALFWEPADGAESDWQAVDPNTPVDPAAKLRLRIAFELHAGTLSNGATLQYKVPSSVHPDTSAGAIEGEVYASPTVGDPSRNGANAIGTYSLDGDVLTLTFNEDVATANAGSAQGDGASDASADAGEKTASALNGYVDLDLGFGQLTCDDSGLATIELNDAVSLKVAKAAEEEASAQSVDDSAATASVEATTDDEQDSAGVESISLMAAAPSATLADATDKSVDLTPYLLKVTVSKLQGTTYVPAVEFNNGDQVETKISYKIPEGVITSTSLTATYQIPEGLYPSEQLHGIIKRNGKEIGTYTISTGGLIELNFDKDKITDGGAISGDITFDGVASNSSTSEDKPIDFGNHTQTVTIKKKQGGGGNEDSNHDVHVRKTATLSEDNKTISYSVTVSSEKGTSGPVSFTDYLNKYDMHNAEPAYKQDSLQLKKVSGNSEQPYDPSSFGLTWDANGKNGPTFSLGALPRLAAGESYVLSYTVDVKATDSSPSLVSNNASASSGSNSGRDYKRVEFKQDVTKTGTYDSRNNTIVWKLEINPNNKDVSNWIVTDTMPGGTKMTKYKVSSADGTFSQTYTKDEHGNQPFHESSLDFHFADLGLTGSQKKQTFYIEIYTDAPAGDDSGFTNTAKTRTNSGTVESTGTVEVKHRTANVTKTHVSDVADATKARGTRKETWSSDVTLPDGNLSGMTYTYTDNIENATDGNGIDLGASSHYAIAADLEAAFESSSNGLCVNLSPHEKYRYVGSGTGRYDDSAGHHGKQDVTFTVTYYDDLNCRGNTVDASNSTTHVKSFKVQVKVAKGTTFSATNMVIGAYPTYMDTTKVEDGRTIIAKNKGGIDNKTSEPQVSYTKRHRILKAVKTADHEFASGSKTLNLSQVQDGKLTYRIKLTTEPSDDNTTITVTDTLPEGMTYVEDSIRAAFFKDEWYEDTTNSRGTNLGKGKANAPKLTTSTTEDGRTILNITIPNFRYDSNPDKQTIALYYDVSIKNDPSWNNGSTQKTYSNTAEWGDSSSTHNTTVKRDEKNVFKSGEQVIDDEENPTNDLNYYVEINPAGVDLDTTSDWLTLTDTFKSNGIECSLEPSSIKLYAYDYSKPHNYDPAREVDGDSYQVKYDSKAHTITVRVPDGIACVLVYTYRLGNSFADYATVSNEASLNGEKTDSKTLSLRKATSSASANQASIVLYKVDAKNFHKQLQGAKFSLSLWDKSQSRWMNKDTQKELVTDANGSITYDLEGNADSLEPNVLYRLVETEAPTGYAGNSTVRYFIIKDVMTGESDSNAFSAAKVSEAKDDHGDALNLQESDVEFFDNNVTSTLYVPNEYTSLTVKKSWADEKGYSTSAPTGSSVQLTLNRMTDYSASVKVIGEGSGNPSQSLLQGKGVSDGTVKVKNGSDFSFNVGYGWTQSFSVYVNGKKYGDYSAPASVTVEGKYISPDTTIEVRMDNWNLPTLTANPDKPWTTPPEGSSSKADTVVLSDSNNWTHSWPNLPKTDEQGNACYYTVKEDSYTVNGVSHVPGTDSYDVSYTNNDGIQQGTITVTNSAKKNQGYELPSTGGTPGPLPWVGGTLAALAGVLLVCRTRPRKS